MGYNKFLSQVTRVTQCSASSYAPVNVSGRFLGSEEPGAVVTGLGGSANKTHWLTLSGLLDDNLNGFGLWVHEPRSLANQLAEVRTQTVYRAFDLRANLGLFSENGFEKAGFYEDGVAFPLVPSDPEALTIVDKGSLDHFTDKLLGSESDNFGVVFSQTFCCFLLFSLGIDNGVVLFLAHGLEVVAFQKLSGVGGEFDTVGVILRMD